MGDARSTDRSTYRLFSEGKIGNLTLKNRLVRSATADVIFIREVNDRVVEIYRDLAMGGVGMIITGNLPPGSPPEIINDVPRHAPLWFDGLERIPEAVHEHGDGCKVFAQIGAEMMKLIGSDYPGRTGKRVMTTAEIPAIIEIFVVLIERLKNAGFDGVQFHGAHGYFFNSLLSPFANNRDDDYGGSVGNRVRMIKEIIEAARSRVGDFPMIIKAGCEDFIEGGYTGDTFSELADALVEIGLDAIETSRGMNPNGFDYSSEWDGLPFEPHARKLDLPIPVILVDSIRDVDKAETLINEGVADFVSMCRPFIIEPDLPNRWREGRGSSKSECIDCDLCSLANYIKYKIITECIFDKHPDLYQELSEKQ